MFLSVPFTINKCPKCKLLIEQYVSGFRITVGQETIACSRCNTNISTKKIEWKNFTRIKKVLFLFKHFLFPILFSWIPVGFGIFCGIMLCAFSSLLGDSLKPYESDRTIVGTAIFFGSLWLVFYYYIIGATIMQSLRRTNPERFRAKTPKKKPEIITYGDPEVLLKNAMKFESQRLFDLAIKQYEVILKEFPYAEAAKDAEISLGELKKKFLS